MIYLKVLLFIVGALLTLYYALMFAHTSGVICVTYRKITVRRMLIPFYYILTSMKEKNPRRPKKENKPVF